MWNKLTIKFSAFILIIAFSGAVIFSGNTVSAQSLWKNNSQNPGTGTTKTTLPEEKSNTAIIYVALGAAIVGLLIYKYVFKKDKKETDSTKTTNSSSLFVPSGSYFTDEQTELAKRNDALPINLFFGIRRDNYAAEEKTYIIGLSLKF